MKVLKEIAVCLTPFVMAALLLYPFMAIVGADFNPFMWGRDDRIFYMLASTASGLMLLVRVMHVHVWEER